MKTIIPVLLMQFLLLAQQAAADSIVESLNTGGAQLKGSVLVFKDGSISEEQAEMRIFPEYVNLEAQTDYPLKESLVSAVGVFQDGRVVSTPLHLWGSDETNRESSSVARQRIETLGLETAELRQKLERLESETRTVGSELRRKAGLNDVDLVYQAVERLDGRIEELQAGLENLRQFRARFKP